MSYENSNIMVIISYFVLLLCIISRTTGDDDFEATLGHIKPHASAFVQAQAAMDVIERLIPDKANLFNVTINPDIGPIGKDTFKILKDGDAQVVIIEATSGVAATWGFHHYLKYFCECHISWDGDQLTLPPVLPGVNLTISSSDRFRYYQNVCTTSYSFVWWDWKRWEREIDWMALNGINLALAFNGQEAIWQRVYHKLNLTSTDIGEQFSGPAFLAWNRMGNLRGWAGPLPASWHHNSIALQHKILTRMRELGIVPILPAFAGQVPRAFKRIFPEANMTIMIDWNHFDDQYCCPYLLEPTEDLFKAVGSLFVSELIAEFGTDHMYSCDTFNEMPPQRADVVYLAAVSRATFEAITDIDPKAVWVKQNWGFVHNEFVWTFENVRAFITAVPIGRMLVLDLQSELQPQYVRLESYFGQPFIWCMLHNFGGTLGLYGSVENINKGVFEGRALPNGTMVGTGLTPEGINQNYVVYDLMNEMAWRREPVNLTQWFSAYAKRRYGQMQPQTDSAWQLLKGSVYNFTGMRHVRGKYVITRQPSLRLRPWFWYNTSDVMLAWDQLLGASTYLNSSTTYRHDMVDISRQALQVLASGFYMGIVKAVNKQNIAMFQKYSALFLNLLIDLDKLLASNKAFLLGSWLESAKACANTSLEEELYEWNARNQITLWGPRGEIKDYANKQWAGIVSHYFLPRWHMFLSAVNASLISHTAFNETLARQHIFLEVERPFTLDRTVFPSSPQGDSVRIALRIHRRWRCIFTLISRLKSFQRVGHHPRTYVKVTGNEIKIGEWK